MKAVAGRQREMQPDTRLKRLVEAALPGARIVAVEALGVDAGSSGASTKGTGYGAPLRIDLELQGARRTVVLHTATANAFGHDRRADRAAEALLAADTFGSVPRHVRALDVGAYRGDDGFVSLRGTGEFYLLSEWADGQLYVESLRRIVRAGALDEGDVARVDRLAEYLAALHRESLTIPFARERALRDLLGSGEGIFGIVDGYPEGEGGVSRERLRGIEARCQEWRWKLKAAGARRLVRTHGDFHPFNVLFDDSGEPLLLDTSRGSMGDAADDVTCMAMNFPFFALERPDTWKSAFSILWHRFWERYLGLSGDGGLLDVAAPFLAWRGLVLASPLWYPDLTDDARSRLLTFIEAALAAERFSPTLADAMFR
jgi:hypothetical protein